MKQIEYTEKQKLVLEILQKFDEVFKPSKDAYDFEKTKYFEKVNEIKSFYGIKEKYLTLREYIKKNSCGAYHDFIFTIGKINVKVMDCDDFARYYNANLLDKYYVLKDVRVERGGNCENYNCEHHLEIVEKS